MEYQSKKEAVSGGFIRILLPIGIVNIILGEGWSHIQVVGEQKPWRLALRASAAAAGFVAGLADLTEIGVSMGGNAAVAPCTTVVEGVTFHAVVPL